MAIKPAPIGSVSSGTLRSKDLADAFYAELEWQLSRQDRTPEDRNELDKLRGILEEFGDECFDNDGNYIDNEIGDEYLNEILPNALQQFAPPYCYFGAHCGDGADFGYWPDLDAIEELPI